MIEVELSREQALALMQTIRIKASGGCIYCEAERQVSIPLGHDSAVFADRLDAEATKLCPCLGDVLWTNGHVMKHKGYRKQRIERAYNALLGRDLLHRPEYADRRRAMMTELSAG